MDVWVVAAAAGAGYVVQHLKNLSKGKNKLLEQSSENLNIVRHKVGDKSCPLRRVLLRKHFGEEMSRGRDNICEAVFDSESASTVGYENENHSIVSDSNSLDAFQNNKDIQGDWVGKLPSESDDAFTSDSLPHPLTGEIGFCVRNGRKSISSLKSRRINSRFIVPQTSLESCLMAKLYEEHAEIEEYTYSPLQKPTVRPFLVTDGSRIISTSPYKSCSGASSHENKTVCGVPRVPNLVSMEVQKKVKTRNRKKHGSHDGSQGTTNRASFFCVGLIMGMVSSILANKHEVEKLNNLLKQTENLVQDLQEELEMKDSLTVKELAAEDYESQDVHKDRCFDDPVHALTLQQNNTEECCDQQAEDKSLSEIEAELEAELERLESSMNSSSLKGKLSNLTKLDPNLDIHVYGDRDGSHSSTPRSVHYPISPRELSLRLHQVIQSRLEERIKELEMALENSQRKVKHMESEHNHQWREPLNYKTGTLSTQNGLTSRDGPESIDQPVIINLSGEALSAYNEAYEESSKVSESDEEDLQIGFENGYHVRDGPTDGHSASNGHREPVFDGRTEEDIYSMLNSRDGEVEDGDDEMERLLIRQIVEKAKQGSPAVLKAQKAFLFLTDENAH